ncbi:DUF3829 domain-containing protein [Flagellimonas sp. 389]|uniref:DUF3829 domain-containing protein n=1 Tax=Flagellimonas sp. 389 TaxID=2835862 RepID=UPI001BD2E9B3|nr:DUF3829 domain-containing protein [Flagellimonas sp. 389]MBS9463792.1 DUF3829 domain-containing protein [Flagellimonas sp. 389]
MKIIKAICILSIVMLTTYSCGENSKKKQTTNTDSKETTVENIIDEKQTYINKYNVYVAVWNNVSPRVERSYNSLYNIINDKTGNPLKDQETYFIPPVPENSAITRLEEVLQQKPEIKELDALGPQLVTAYKELRPALQQLSDYYKLQSYKDDDFAKSPELYFKVRKPIKDFIEASSKLGLAVQEIDKKLSFQAMEEYKANDQLLLYNKGMIINSIKSHSAPLYNISYDEYAQLDMDAFDKDLQDLIKHYSAFKELANDKERVKAELNISRPSPFIIYYNTIDTYIRESRNFRELIDSSKKYVAMKSIVERMGLQFASSSHQKVLDAAERVINSSNSLN